MPPRRFALDTAQALIYLINIIIGIIELMLGLRILLRLFGANPATPFVAWVYNSTNSLLGPFRNMFPVTEVLEGSFLDFTALFALIAYAVLGFLLAQIIDYAVDISSERRRRITTIEE